MNVSRKIGLVCGFALGTFALPPARAQQHEAIIQQMIDRGVAGLKKLQTPEGHYGNTMYGVGSTALACLTLLECGVPEDDPGLRKAIALVRQAAPKDTEVYHLALFILLLDRVGDPADIPLIQAMTVRLLEGQSVQGGWGYRAPAPPEAEVARLKAVVDAPRVLRTSPPATAKSPPERPVVPLDPDLEARIQNLHNRQPEARIRNFQQEQVTQGIDNSNTQFAILGLWAGRRHGVAVDPALRVAETYFRMTHVQGAWPYRPGTEVDERPSNTCAGLLGLAIGTGLVRERQLKAGSISSRERPQALRDPLRDPLVQVALNHLGNQLRLFVVKGIPQGIEHQRDFYFLWSIERVGMVYSLKRIGGVDWYELGCQILARTQSPEGFWKGNLYPREVDTCFALLFLKRANLAMDLTANLLAKPKPHEQTLSAGKEGGSGPALQPTEADRLVEEVLKADPERHLALLEQLRDRKGGEYTEALAFLIPKLAGPVQKQARNALAERLARMSATTLADRLQDENPEIRRAAALAVGMRDEKSLIPNLILTLEDVDVWVVRAAAVALKMTTHEDFGPMLNASEEERKKAIKAWKSWWSKQARKTLRRP